MYAANRSARIRLAALIVLKSNIHKGIANTVTISLTILWLVVLLTIVSQIMNGPHVLATAFP